MWMAYFAKGLSESQLRIDGNFRCIKDSVGRNLELLELCFDSDSILLAGPARYQGINFLVLLSTFLGGQRSQMVRSDDLT